MNKIQKLMGKAAVTAAAIAMISVAMADQGSGQCPSGSAACKVSGKCGTSLYVDFSWCCPSGEYCKVRQVGASAWATISTFGAALSYCNVQTGCGS